MRGNGGQKRRRTHNINLILWVTLSAFALVVIVVFLVVQNLMMALRYRDETEQELAKAGEQMRKVIERPLLTIEQIGTKMLGVANEYSVRAYLFYCVADTVYLYPRLAVSEDEEAAREEELLRTYETIAGELDESECNAMFFSATEQEVSYATKVSVNGAAGYLYLSQSLSVFSEVASKMRLTSVTTGALAVILAFVVSGFVSMLISKPVTEVTEKAKELARGNYNLTFEKHYYCTEVQELSEALEYAGAEISKADNMQKELIANVSHDFKTPLTMIKAYASMIQEISGDDKEKRQRHTQVIIDESDRLTALVSDVLDLSKLRAGITELDLAVFNLSEDVYGVAKRFDYLAVTQGYTIEIDVEEDLYTLANRDRVGQVLYNLIGNAVNYTGEDKKVLIRLKRKGEALRFCVTDTGKGIPPEQIPTIWERYYRSSETHKRPVRGTGLGLSIVKAVLERHKIPFGVESEVGKGSTFYVDFPEAPPEEEIQE